MARRKWTLVIVADDSLEVRQIRLSRETMRLAIALVMFLVAGLSSIGTSAYLEGARTRADARLVRENRLLEGELGNVTALVDTLRSSLEQLADQDMYYRLMAGLEPIDADVQQVGIGGPDGNTLEEHELFDLNSTAARKSLEATLELDALVRRADLLAFSWRQAEDSLQEKHAQFAALPSILPTHGYISSSFSPGRMHPILNLRRPHAGIDVVAPIGTPIIAPARGRVRRVTTQREYGQMVEIDHGYGVMTRYAHASKMLVRTGQLVERGDTIALVGETGLAVGPHLHYEVLVNGRAANPRQYIFNLSTIPD